MTIADSFIDEDPTPTCLEDLSPREKIEYFVKGMQDNAFDLVCFRAAADTASAVADQEANIWQIKNALELVLSSIRCERDAKKRPTVILSMVQ